MKCIDCVRCNSELEKTKYICDYTGDELKQDELEIPNKCAKFLRFPKDELLE